MSLFIFDQPVKAKICDLIRDIEDELDLTLEPLELPLTYHDPLEEPIDLVKLIFNDQIRKWRQKEQMII